MTFTAPIQLPGLALDPQWYRRAVFYEVMVRSFYDANGDGTGDLAGACECSIRGGGDRLCS